MGRRFVGGHEGRRAIGKARVLPAIVLSILVQAAQAAEPSPVYRFYNTRNATHFYTISSDERDTVLAKYPWFTLEGAVFDAHTDPTTGTTPVYRFYNSQTGTHFYTMSEQEKNHVIATYPVFVYEGARYYAPAESAAGRMPLYRFFNTRTGARFYTTSAEERDHVARTWPWFAFEGTSYYVFVAAASTSVGNTTPSPGHHTSTRNHDASARRQYNATAQSAAADRAGAVEHRGDRARLYHRDRERRRRSGWQGPGASPFYMNGTRVADLTAPPYSHAASVHRAGYLCVLRRSHRQCRRGHHDAVAKRPCGGVDPPPVASKADVWRLLNQATFGASQAEAAQRQGARHHRLDRRPVRQAGVRLPGRASTTRSS